MDLCQTPNQSQEPESFEVDDFYEYKGVEGYNPTRVFLIKVYKQLIIQILIIIASFYLVRPFIANYFSSNSEINNVIYTFYLEFALALLLFSQTLCFQRFIRSNNKLCHSIFFLRTLGLILVIGILGDYIQFYLYLILTLYLSLRRLAIKDDGEINWKKYFQTIIIWAVFWFCLVNFINSIILKKSDNSILTSFSILIVFLYGVYLIVEISFILRHDTFYHIHHHEHVFGALVIQFDLVGLYILLKSLIKKLF